MKKFVKVLRNHLKVPHKGGRRLYAFGYERSSCVRLRGHFVASNYAELTMVHALL